MKDEIEIPFEPQNLFATVWSPDEGKDSIGAIVAVHGVGSSGAREYYYYGPYMAKRGWTVIAYDCPGFGHWQPKEKRALKEHVEMFPSSVHASLLKARELVPNGPLVLTGLSMGGAIVAQYITEYARSPSRQNPQIPRYNEKVGNLLENPAPKLNALVGIVPGVGLSAPKRMMIPMKIVGALVPNKMFNLFERIASSANMTEEQQKAMMEDMALHYDDPPDDGYGTELLSFGFLKNFLGMTQKTGLVNKSYKKWPVDVPTIFLTGEDDPVVNPDQVKMYFDGLPDMDKEYHCYEGCSHPLQFHKKREEYYEDIHQFLLTYT
ncbi:MAG: alpha/beta hydrolase [Candidatus Thorarchaeota archaeon]|jgi:alpha-beta hydrolase superfamily lysophospholipase